MSEQWVEHIKLVRKNNPGHCLMVFINGVLSEKDSDTLPDKLLFSGDDQRYQLEVAKHAVIKKPIHFLYLQSENNAQHKHKRFIANEHSELHIIEEYRSYDETAYSNDMVCEILSAPHAHVNYFKIQNEALTATHLSKTFIQQAKESSVNHFVLTLGGKLASEIIDVDLNETAAACQLLGLYSLLGDQQQSDYALQINHAASHSLSNLFYKGILDKKSKASLKGKVHVKPAIEKINANQANHNLLLSNQAEAMSKPELEIYADDVKCSHGATVGEIDEEALFYLRSRGIDMITAKKYLLSAFAEDVISHINHPLIFQYVSQVFEQRVAL